MRVAILLSVAILTLGWISSCGLGGANFGPGINPNVTVTITNKPDGIPQGTSYTFNVTVTGDPGNKGVTWTLDPSTGPGTLTNMSPFSVTYNAPATAPFPNNASTLSLIANSVFAPFNGDGATIEIAIPGLTTTITNKMLTIYAGGAPVTLNVRVLNDPHNAGVTWFITGPYMNCQVPTGSCGTLTNETPFSVVYTPPATVPSSPNNVPTIQANSISDPTEYDRDIFTIQ